MICIPLYYIHSKKMIHRDIKPHNILIKQIGEKELCVITDFGLFQIPNSNFLVTVKTAMTPFYASLE